MVAFYSFSDYIQTITKNYCKIMNKNEDGLAIGGNFTYDAQVKSVKDNCVTFALPHDLTGVYFLPQNSQINPHTLFKIGCFWPIKVNKIIKRFRQKENYSYPETWIYVTPQNFPTDDYVKHHPLGSKVTGIVKHQYHSGDCLIHLAPDVECTVNSHQHFHKGQEISCKLQSDNSQTKKLSINII